MMRREITEKKRGARALSECLFAVILLSYLGVGSSFVRGTFLDRNVSHVGFTLEKKKKASRVKAY